MMNILRCMMKPVDLQLQGRLFFDLFLFAPCHQTGCELGAWFGLFASKWIVFASLGLVLLNNFAIRHNCGHFGRKEGEVPFAPNLWPVSAGRRSVIWWHCDILTIWNTQLKWEKIAKIYYFLLSIILVYEVGIFYMEFCMDLTRPDWLKLILLQQLFWAWLELYRRQFSSHSHFSSFRASMRSFLQPQCSLSWLSGRYRVRDFPSNLN